MTLPELVRLKHRAYLRCVIGNKRGHVFCAISKGWNFDGDETFLFRQTNTEETPIEFECTYRQFSDAMEEKKIKFV